MHNRNKGKAIYIFTSVSLLLLLAITIVGRTKFVVSAHFHNSLTKDTPIPKKTKLPPVLELQQKVKEEALRKETLQKQRAEQAKRDSAAAKADTNLVVKTDTFSIKYSTDSLAAPVRYHADDSMVLDVPGKKILLYGKETKTTYQDNELIAPGIVYDQQTNMVTAALSKDSLGNVISYAKFKQADFSSFSDTIRFNMKTGKGQTKGTYFMQNEMFVFAEVSKKIDSNTIYARRARFTTCNLDTPHFAFVSNKVKFINQKIAFTGPVHPEFEGVPVPIVLPFGIYPLRQGRHSGILAPSFTANEQFGLALENMGYYKVLSDNWDVTVRGTLYSYGGWTAIATPRYYKRYRYQGNMSLNIQRLNIGLKSDKDFRAQRSFNFQWSHSSDTKARPGVTFNARVNAGSSGFNEQVPNSPARNFTNQLSSSISYSKVWKDRPYNFTINANHDQNTRTKLINVTIPDFAFNLNTLYPFRRKETVGELRWYENLGIALNTSVKSATSFYDTVPDIANQISDNFRWGASHSVPITLSLPQLGPLQIAPSVSYTEHWYQRRLIRTWNETRKKIDSVQERGFYTGREMSFGLGITTRIFGMFTFGKKSFFQAIRHEIRPSIGISYRPDLSAKNFRTIQGDSLKNPLRYSIYDANIYGIFGEGQFGGINISIDNNIQAKVRNKKDTGAAAIKKLTLIDGFSLSTNYNLLADSFAFSPVSISLRTNLLEKINITASATTDLYEFNTTTGRPENTLIWKNRPASIGRLTGATVSLQSQVTGGKKGSENGNNAADALNSYQQRYDPRTGQPLDEFQQEAAYVANNPGEFADFSIPWSFNFGYSLRIQRTFQRDKRRIISDVSQDITLQGDVNLTPRWKLGLGGTYNITAKDLGLVSMFISREMHCWQMTINVSPVGRFRFFNFTISPKSGLLRDLRINRTRYFNDI